MSKLTALTGHPSTNPPIKLFCLQACRVPGQRARWAGRAGHLLLSHQTKKFQNFLPMAFPIKPTLQGCLKLLLGQHAGFQGGESAGWARAARCELYRRPATLGAHAPWGFAKTLAKGVPKRLSQGGAVGHFRLIRGQKSDLGSIDFRHLFGEHAYTERNFEPPRPPPVIRNLPSGCHGPTARGELLEVKEVLVAMNCGMCHYDKRFAERLRQNGLLRQSGP
eukprot:1153256-Pelagomonas_calceolata.AAC.5